MSPLFQRQNLLLHHQLFPVHPHLQVHLPLSCPRAQNSISCRSCEMLTCPSPSKRRSHAAQRYQ